MPHSALRRIVSAAVIPGLTLLLAVGSRGAVTHNLTNFSDDLASPPAGSLRALILSAAQSGDTIAFPQAREIVLAGPLEIPAALTALTIRGPGSVARGRKPATVIVRGSSTQLRGLGWKNLQLQIAQGVSGVSVLGCTFTGKNGSILVQPGAADTEIGSLDEPNSFLGSPAAAIEGHQTTRLRVIGNLIRGGETGLFEVAGNGLIVQANGFEGTNLRSACLSGEIRGNRFEDPPGFGILVESLHTSLGEVLIQDNELLSSISNVGIECYRRDTRVIQNTLRGAGIAVGSHELDAGGGEIRVEYNSVSDAPTGVRCVAGSGTLTAIVENNNIRSSRFALELGCGPDNTLICRNNTIVRAGTGRRPGIGIDLTSLGTSSIESNTVERTTGIGVNLSVPSAVAELRGNTVLRATNSGVYIHPGEGVSRLTDNLIRDCGGSGIYCTRKVLAEVVGGEVKGNAEAGVFVGPQSRVRVSGVAMGANGGPGIDLLPIGVTPNSTPRRTNENIPCPDRLRHDDVSMKVLGRTVPASVVDVFRRETGARTGNPKNGEGVVFLGRVTAEADGSFTWPIAGAITCGEAKKLCFTSTVAGSTPYTSEFSPDLKCTAPRSAAQFGQLGCQGAAPGMG